MIRVTVIGSVVLALVPGVAPSATIHVPSDYPTINDAIDAAVPGDQVLVAPGTYSSYDVRNVGGSYSSCCFMKSGVAVVSEQGPVVTTIDLQDWEPNSIPHVVLATGVVSSSIEGFTVRGGSENFSTCEVAGSDGFLFRDCIFSDLESYSGAGALTTVGSNVDVVDCSFLRCTATRGGAIEINGGAVLLSGCLFEECEARSQGGAVYARNSDFSGFAYLTVQHCRFLRNKAVQGGGALVELGQSLDVSESLFYENELTDGLGATGIAIVTGATEASIVDCVLAANSVPSSLQTFGAAVWRTARGTGPTFEVSGCSFVNNLSPGGTASAIAIADNHGGEISRCVFVGGESTGGAVSTSGVQPDIECSVFWSNAGGPGQDIGTNIIADPFFCDPVGPDYSVQSNSPCLPQNSNGCGQIGAFGEGCGTVSVEPTSWSQIKSNFRPPTEED